MSLQFSISPDFNADQLSQWFIFNTWMQRALARPIHFEPYDEFAALRAALAADKVDLIYANPFDTAFLVREQGFLPIARARRRSDEAIVAVAAGSPARRIADLASPLRVAATDAPDVEMIGRILLEPAGLGRGDIQLTRKALLASLLAMHLSERSSHLLADLGFLDGWEEMTLEDAEFMIDLMDTLID